MRYSETKAYRVYLDTLTEEQKINLSIFVSTLRPVIGSIKKFRKDNDYQAMIISVGSKKFTINEFDYKELCSITGVIL